MSRTAAAGILTALALACPVPVEAGTVTGVSVSPASPTLNQAATVTITGQNPCGAVHVDFGDGSQQTYQTAFPIQASHTWTTTGSKTITATGQGTNCSGKATTTINVKNALTITKLCQIIDCVALMKPTITQTFGFAKPGGTLAIIGKNFGTKPGSVVATLTTWNGQTLKKTLQVIEWKNTLVGVNFPTDITGVKQHNGTLQVTVGVLSSDPRTFTFFPTNDFRELHATDVKVISCGDDSNSDECNGQKDSDDDWFSSGTDDALSGYHMNVWGAIGDDTGTDSYQISLKNGWEMLNFYWDIDGDEVSATKPTGFQPVANWSPSTNWVVTPNDQLAYQGVITMHGPIGVPYK